MSNLNLTEEYSFQRRKMNYFSSNTGINDNDTAINYLILAEWDERKAVQIYLLQHNNRNMNPQNNNSNRRVIPPQNNNQIDNQYRNQNNNNRSMPSQGGYNSYMPSQHNNQNQYIPQQNNNQHLQSDTNEFHIDNELIKNNAAFIEQDRLKYDNLILFINTKLQFVAKTFENFIKFLKEHAGIIIIFNTNKIDEVKSHIIKVNSDPLGKDIIINSVLFPVLSDSIIGRKIVSQFSCISFPSYFFCKYKGEKDITITGRMEGIFNSTLLNDYLLNSIPESKNELRSSLRRSFNKSIIDNIINNDNNERGVNNVNNNNTNNKDNFIDNYNNFFLGNSADLNRLIESLGEEDLNNNRNNNNSQNINNSHNINNSQNINYSNNQNINYNNSLNNNNDYLGDSNINNGNNIRESNLNNSNLNNSNNISESNINNSIRSNNSINIKDSIAGLSEGQIFAKREREMEKLERQQEEKMRKEKEEELKKKEEEKKIKEEENRIKQRDEEYNKEAEYSKQLLPPEPEENDPNACKIMLKYPDGVKTVERRFLKSEKIEVLYHLVKSKGREIFMEKESNDFVLLFGFPPKNLENSKNLTLESEGMFPSSMIQIREK